MTDDELAAWGKAERAARSADLAEFHEGKTTLESVQQAASVRRRAIGLSRAAVDHAMQMAKSL